jgi:uncharacterized protein GlcG (DUF336 family)
MSSASSIRVTLWLLAPFALGACGSSDRIPAAAQAQAKEGKGATTQQGAAKKQEKPGARSGGCDQVPDSDELKKLLELAPQKVEAGGLAGGRNEWAAVVNREGEICAIAVSTEDPAAAWPGSQSIAMAKAFTANAFSTDVQPLSTARLYTLSQPGHSLWGAGAANPFKPECLATPKDAEADRRVCGGTIVFGGGVPLYRGKTRVGGLGASGDTACADHEIAKRMRSEAGLDPEKGAAADDIVFPSVDGPSIYGHPMCPNTFRNGKKLGDEPAAKSYKAPATGSQ